jgi:hypothetical protein
MSIARLMQMAAAGAGGDYQISRSLRFNSADSAYLSRTPASASNRKTWTWSAWVKRSGLGTADYIFSGSGAATGTTAIRFETNNTINFYTFDSVYTARINTSQVFRDVSSWYHIVAVFNTDSATTTLTGSATDRLRLYINGVQVSAFSDTDVPTLDYEGFINSNVPQTFNARYNGSYVDINGNFYLTEINFIDGQALTPSSFGETNATTGVWSPIAYAGSYGTNGFYLNFSDNTSTTTLGEDQAGSNDWTLNNFSVTAGAGNDSLVDTPTQYGTDTGAGGEVRGNYATFNVLASPQLAGQYVVSNGNLDITPTGASSTFNSYAPATIALPSSDKYYFEYTCTNADGGQRRDVIGLAQTTASGIWLGNTGSIGYDCFEGKVNNNGSNIATYASWDNGDIVSVAVDCATGYVWFAKNGTWQAGSPSAGTGATATLSNISTYAFAIGTRAASSAAFTVKGSVNFGQRPFAYTAPSGFKALVTTNLPQPTVVQGDDYFNTVLFTGNYPTGQSITGVGFAPDLTWFKSRSVGDSHNLVDKVRGAFRLKSNTTDAETSATVTLDSDGFTVGAQSESNNDSMVAWNWKANGAGVSNTAGTITGTVTVSANTIAGISIVTYTGNDTAGATVGHGLGAVPRMIIVKNRDATDAWQVYHAANTASPETDYLVLNTTAATADALDRWNDTAPTSSVFSLGDGAEVNTDTEDYVAYCFAEVEGFSKFGSYTGNGIADGPFVYTGFRPAFVLGKDSSSTNNWFIFDSVRDTYNVAGKILRPNLPNEELDSPPRIDLLSNGFKVRSTGLPNDSGETYIYAAFAENPFKYSLAR